MATLGELQLVAVVLEQVDGTSTCTPQLLCSILCFLSHRILCFLRIFSVFFGQSLLAFHHILCFLCIIFFTLTLDLTSQPWMCCRVRWQVRCNSVSLQVIPFLNCPLWTTQRAALGAVATLGQTARALPDLIHQVTPIIVIDTLSACASNFGV